MDISKPIIYRGLALNAVVLGTGRALRGISIESVDYSNIDVVGYTEKRAAADGLHASDVYLGARTIDMVGHIYALSLPELFDYLHLIRSVFSPTSAYQESPGDRGFLPLSFFQSTEDVTSFPAIPAAPPDPAYDPGTVRLYMNVRPQRPPQFSIVRDRQDVSGANHGQKPVATPWSVRLLAKDPRVYVNPGKVIDLTGAANPGGTTVQAVNRGDYETPLNIMLVVAAAPGVAGTVRVTGLNSVDMTITIENKANVTYRWFGDDRVLMTQDTTGGVLTRPFVLRQDLVTFATLNHRPMVPAQINPPTKPFSTPVTYIKSIPLATGSRLFWSEAFA